MPNAVLFKYPVISVEKHFFQKPPLLSQLQTPDTEPCLTWPASPPGGPAAFPLQAGNLGRLGCPKTLYQAIKTNSQNLHA